MQAAVARDAQASDLVQPGHIFPLLAQDGGVLMRAGHTEAGCDLAGMAGLTPSAVICEIMNDDGTMARLPDLERFASEHDLKIGTIAALIQHRSHNESLIEALGEREIHTAQGPFRCSVFRDLSGGGLHLALTVGAWSAASTRSPSFSRSSSSTRITMRPAASSATSSGTGEIGMPRL